MGQLPKFNTENEDLKLFKKHDTKSKRLQYNLLIVLIGWCQKGPNNFTWTLCNYSKFLMSTR